MFLLIVQLLTPSEDVLPPLRKRGKLGIPSRPYDTHLPRPFVLRTSVLPTAILHLPRVEYPLVAFPTPLASDLLNLSISDLTMLISGALRVRRTASTPLPCSHSVHYHDHVLPFWWLRACLSRGCPCPPVRLWYLPH